MARKLRTVASIPDLFRLRWPPRTLRLPKPSHLALDFAFLEEHWPTHCASHHAAAKRDAPHGNATLRNSTNKKQPPKGRLFSLLVPPG